ncbi:hypothetical protein ACFL27_02940 [candidate division CSSED10-310 bacterium]|uniref:GWxTD domain-containing protein n=1 Tax=candidate division CSSED10-310 bacterium TaxID=2855610 RepID=A0ABV6YSG9_UNCC1
MLLKRFLLCILFLCVHVSCAIGNNYGALPTLFLIPGQLDQLSAEKTNQEPEYSRLYDQLNTLEGEDKLEAALRLIPKIYAVEVPVEAFYRTLEQKRGHLLEKLIQRGTFSIGKSEFTFTTLRQIFWFHYLLNPEMFHSQVMIGHDLPLSRFSYFMIVTGREHTSPKQDPLLEPALPAFDAKSTLNSADPWLVSASLFLTRKKEHDPTLNGLIMKRWQERPDLWDQTCTEQALLFFARQPQEILRKFKIEDGDIKRHLTSFQNPVPNNGSVQILFFDPSQSSYIPFKQVPSGLSLVKYVKKKRNRNTIIKQRTQHKPADFEFIKTSSESIDQKLTKNRIMILPPGYYSLSFQSGNQPAMSGESKIFSSEPASLIRVFIGISGGV